MSAAVIVSKDKKQTNKAALDKAEFSIGRSVKCDLVLDDDTISRRHAVIRWNDAGEYILCDNEGRNGTIYKGRPINKDLTLRDGDKFNIGPFEILFLSEESDIPEGATRGLDEAKLQQIREQADAVKELPGNLAIQLLAEAGPLKGTKFNNWNGDLSLGRHVDNDVVIPDDAMSNFHAVIRYTEEGYVVEDLGSANGTFVDGIRVTKELVKSKAHIRLGSSTFLFTSEDLMRKKIVRYAAFGVFVFILLLMAVVKHFMPEPAWTPHFNAAVGFYKSGQIEAAVDPLQKVLAIEPRHAEARGLLAKCKEQVLVNRMVSDLEQRIGVEQWRDALELCDKILAIRPGQSDAVEQGEVLRSLVEALQAIENQQWVTAIERLKKASTFYPNSSILKSELQKAEQELANQRRYDIAMRQISSGRLEMIEDAFRSLRNIPDTSFYHEKAIELIAETSEEKARKQAISDAFTAYQDADLAKAAQLVSLGSNKYPDEKIFKQILEKITRIGPHHARVNGAKPQGVQEIHFVLEAVEQIMKIERDPANKVLVNAHAVQAELVAQLKSTAETQKVAGDGFRKSGDLAAAAKSYMAALEATPDLAGVDRALKEISEEVSVQIRIFYQEGLRLKELNEHEKARERFTKVLNATWPGHEYHRKAKELLATL